MTFRGWLYTQRASLAEPTGAPPLGPEEQLQLRQELRSCLRLNRLYIKVAYALAVFLALLTAGVIFFGSSHVPGPWLPATLLFSSIGLVAYGTYLARENLAFQLMAELATGLDETATREVLKVLMARWSPETATAGQQKSIKILFLAANPSDSARLSLGEEYREIEEGLMAVTKSGRFELRARWATRPRDLLRALLDERPTILHFSGHGEGDSGLVLESKESGGQLISGNGLAEVLKQAPSEVQCMLLNACYAEQQAKSISRYIPYVIGMRGRVSDQAAITFATAFYDALGRDMDIPHAFEWARASLALTHPGHADLPVLLDVTTTG